jgi:hypothetical protein
MSFEFEPQESFNRNQFSSNTGSSGSVMVDFLIKQGIVKDAASANAVLTTFALLGIAASIYFFIFGFNLPQGDTPTPPSVVQEEVEF